MQQLKVSESAFQRDLIDLAHTFGWTIAHFRSAKTENGYRTAVQGDGAGYPDCCLVRPPRLVFAELKSETGKVSDAQREWLDRLKACFGCEVYVWKPSDFERIVEVLKR